MRSHQSYQQEEEVPSHQQIRKSLSTQERSLHKWILRLIVILVILSGLLLTYGLQKFVGGRSVSTLKEEAKKEVFESLQEQDQQTAQEQLQYISYQKLLNSSNLTTYLMKEVGLHVQNVDQEYMNEFNVHRIKQRFQKNLTGTHVLLKKYLQLEGTLKLQYNDGLQMTEDLYRTYFDYENCRKNIRLEKDNLLASTLDLQRKRMEEMSDYVELSDKQKEQNHNQQDQQKLLEITREQVKFYREEINSLTVNRQDNRDIEQLLKEKIKENGEYDMNLLELEQSQHYFDQQMKRIRERLEEYYKENTRLNMFVVNYEKQIEFLQLEIRDKTLDFSINKILREMGISKSLEKQLELAKVIKQKLNFQIKMAGIKVSRMSDDELIIQEKEIKQSQEMYRELMIIVNQLKRKAFVHKMENISAFVGEKQKKVKELLNEINKYKLKINQNTEIIEILLKQLQKIQMEQKKSGETKIRVELSKGLNTEFIEKHQGNGGSRESDLDILKAKLIEAEDKMYQIQRDIKANIDYVDKDKSSYVIKKDSGTAVISQTQDKIIDYLNELNIKINNCKAVETKLQELVKASDEQSELIRQQLHKLKEVQKEIQTAVRNM